MEQFPKVAASSSYAEEIIPNQRLKIDREGLPALSQILKYAFSIHSLRVLALSVRPYVATIVTSYLLSTI